MKNLTATKKLLAVAVAGALSFASAGASAAQIFTYDLDGVSGGTTVVANAMAGGSSEFLQANLAGTAFTGSGWLEMTSFKLNSASIAGTSQADTGLYALYSLTATWDPSFGGTFGGANSFYSISGLTISLYYDADHNNVYNQAAASSNTLATVSNTGGDKLLATGVGGGSAFLFGGGAASFSSSSTIVLTALGEKFFIDPNPFYQYAFESFMGNQGAWDMNSTGGLAIGAASGDITLPEPASLALLGLGLAGLGLSRRRKQ